MHGAVCVFLPVREMSRAELNEENRKARRELDPAAPPNRWGMAAEVRDAATGTREEFRLALIEPCEEPAVAFLGRMHEACAARFGPGLLDVEPGGFVWRTAELARVKDAKK